MQIKTSQSWCVGYLYHITCVILLELGYQETIAWWKLEYFIFFVWSFFMDVPIVNVVSVLSLICPHVSILSESLHTISKYQIPGPALQSQSSPVCYVTSGRPFLMWWTRGTKESQWSVVAEVASHPLATAGADRGRFGGSGVRKMPHVRSSVTQFGPLRWQWRPLRAKSCPHFQLATFADATHSGYQFPLVRLACASRFNKLLRCHWVSQR